MCNHLLQPSLILLQCISARSSAHPSMLVQRILHFIRININSSNQLMLLTMSFLTCSSAHLMLLQCKLLHVDGSEIQLIPTTVSGCIFSTPVLVMGFLHYQPQLVIARFLNHQRQFPEGCHAFRPMTPCPHILPLLFTEGFHMRWLEWHSACNG